jgi:CheY-like chemotaxis protein
MQQVVVLPPATRQIERSRPAGNAVLRGERRRGRIVEAVTMLANLEQQTERDLEQLRVMIVEDHVEIARLFGMLLKSHGCQVHICGNGLDAIRAVNRFGPDVVLLDLRLPGVDGYQVAEYLHSRLGPERPLIIVLTAYSQDRYREMAMAAGADLYLTKPISGHDLIRHIIETPLRED